MILRRSAWAAALLVLAVLGCQQERRAGGDRSEGGVGSPTDFGGASAAPERAPGPPAAITTGTAAVAKERVQDVLPQLREPQLRAPQVRDTAAAGPMLIRTGSATIEVDSLEPAVARVRALAQQLGGFVANTTMHTGREQVRSATLELKFPATRWQQAVGGLTPIGKLEALSEHTADVGEEYVDVSARVANARRLEERLVDLLTRRTGRLEDVLAVERELARVREEIDRYEGRLRYLRARVALSTLAVTVHEPRPIVGAYPGASVLGGAFKQSWRNFVQFIAALIASLGILVPLALILAATWLVVRRVRSQRPRPATPNDSAGGGA